LVLRNVGSVNITLVHDATSTAANRFTLNNAANMQLVPGAAVALMYDGTVSRWSVLQPIAIAATAPSSVGSANSAGTSGLVSARDHVHDGLLRFIFPFSQAGTLATGVGKFFLYNDTGYAMTIIAVRVRVNTAPTGATLIIDVNKNGTTIYTTQANRPTVAISGTTVKSTNPDVTSLADGDNLSIDIDQVGSTVAGADMTVAVIARMT
jgi:hypothetical protein